jgi:hypothetical protein
MRSQNAASAAVSEMIVMGRGIHANGAGRKADRKREDEAAYWGRSPNRLILRRPRKRPSRRARGPAPSGAFILRDALTRSSG